MLADRLAPLAGRDVVVLGLPRGGVPVAFEVAQRLRAPLDVLLVRKLGVPFHPELAFGAIGEGGVRILNDAVVLQARLSPADMAGVEQKEAAELARRAERYRRGRAPVPLTGRTAVVVDDGLATGATAKAACQVARAQGAGQVVLAVPIGARDTVAELSRYADEVVCLYSGTSRRPPTRRLCGCSTRRSASPVPRQPIPTRGERPVRVCRRAAQASAGVSSP